MFDERLAIIAPVRTAIGRFGGSLKDVPALDLGAHVVRETVRRSGLELAQIERVVAGENLQVTKGGNPARHVLLRAGIPVTSDDYSINMNCSSGLRAMTCLAQDILMGDVEVGVAVGMESMTNAPYLLEGARFGYRLGNGILIDYLADYILGDAGPMAEAVAGRYGIGREEQDEFAAASQSKAVAAIEAGRFKEQIVAIDVPSKAGPVPFEVDEHPRADSTIEKLARLRPAFKADGTVTAGNSSGINDGAAAAVIMSEKRAKESGAPAAAYLRGWSAAGVEPGMFGIGPVPAVRKLLSRVGLSLQDIGLIEINEAFASSTVAVIKELDLDPAIVNVNGGAIALGHPVGATGLVLVTKLAYEMALRGVRHGIATMCVGSGQGMAVLLERD
ncbi:MAG: thiolase family protein [Chloroflexi bacterium]|nr:thiolase family protein [Chloroflexota bacterium]